LEFAEFGFAGARVNRIARRAGVNKQLLFYYFGSKQGLYDSVIQQVASEVPSIDISHGKRPQPTEVLRNAFTAFFESVSSRPLLARLLVLDSHRPGHVPGTGEHALSRFVAQVRTVVVEGQAHGYFRDDIDPELVARQALVLVIGYLALEEMVTATSHADHSGWVGASADLLVRALTW
jgi:AcrR family transcriptional regulator